MKQRKSFLLRMDPALCEALEAWAQQELRSVNGQIEYILKEAVAKRRNEMMRDVPPTTEARDAEPGGLRPAARRVIVWAWWPCRLRHHPLLRAGPFPFARDAL